MGAVVVPCSHSVALESIEPGAVGERRDIEGLSDQLNRLNRLTTRLSSPLCANRVPLTQLLAQLSAPEVGELFGKGAALLVTGSGGRRTRRQIHQVAAEGVEGVAVRHDGFHSAAG